MSKREKEIEAIIKNALDESDVQKMSEKEARFYVYQKLREKYGNLINWKMLDDLLIDKTPSF